MRQKIKADGIKLHLGAFDCSLEGWLNTDITPHIWISRMPFASAILYKIGLLPEQRYLQHKAGVFSRLKYMDLTKPLPLPDESCVAVFSSHVLEHLFVAEVKQLLAEIRRVLKYGGVCRIVVPDLERIMALYDKIDLEPFLEGIFEAGKSEEFTSFRIYGGLSQENIAGGGVWRRYGLKLPSRQMPRSCSTGQSTRGVPFRGGRQIKRCRYARQFARNQDASITGSRGTNCK